MRFPKTRRDIRPYLGSLAKSGKQFVTRNRSVVAGVTAVLVLGVVVSAWAVSGGERRPARSGLTPYSMAAKPHAAAPHIAKRAALPKAGSLASGRKLLDAKKYDEAIDVFQPLVDEDVEARFWLGTAHVSAGHDFRGCRQLEKYVELAPKGRYVTAAKVSLKKC